MTQDNKHQPSYLTLGVSRGAILTIQINQMGMGVRLGFSATGQNEGLQSTVSTYGYITVLPLVKNYLQEYW